MKLSRKNLTRFGEPFSHQGSEPHSQFNGYESALAAKEKNQKQHHADPFDVDPTWEEVHGDDGQNLQVDR